MTSMDPRPTQGKDQRSATTESSSETPRAPRRREERPPADVYQMVTDRITAALESGTVPWKKPWASVGGLPRNLATRRPYRGMNVLLLSLGQPYASSWWLTYKQAQDLGGQVRKGERSSLVTFWKLEERGVPSGDAAEAPDTELGKGRERRRPILRYYHVFNVEQCDGIEAPPSAEYLPKQHARLEQCETIIRGMPRRPAITRDPRQACYSPDLDRIGMPDLAQFDSAEEYYGTLFHELVHSTGHPSRLGRAHLGTPAPFGTPDYSREELVAEFGAAFLCGQVGILPRVVDNSAAYIGGWLSVLKGDKRLLPVAAAQAQRAADFILGAASGTQELEPATEEPTIIQRGAEAAGLQSDIQRVAVLIAADPEFQAGKDTFAHCVRQNRYEGWTYRYHPNPARPERIVESFIRLTPLDLDRAYQLAQEGLKQRKVDRSDLEDCRRVPLE